MAKTIEEKIDDIHESMIRMEPVCEDVKSLKKWRDGNGVPGAKFQLWVLWCLFIAVIGVVLK
jgi:hypothetical protein